MRIGVSGKGNFREITEIAKKRIKEELETVSGVGYRYRRAREGKAESPPGPTVSFARPHKVPLNPSQASLAVNCSLTSANISTRSVIIGPLWPPTSD